MLNCGKLTLNFLLLLVNRRINSLTYYTARFMINLELFHSLSIYA